MYSHRRNDKNDVGVYWHCEEIQNNCDRCGKLYRYNWRRRRTREKTCSLCANELKCNVMVNIKSEKRGEIMNFEQKTTGGNFYFEKKTWNGPMAASYLTDSSAGCHSLVSESMKKGFGFHEFSDQVLSEMKMEFEEELQNPQKSLKTDFDWPSTNQLSKVNCLRAFNVMKQILLKEISKCEELIVPDPLVLKRKFYLERRFQSLEKEKIRRLKVYENLYIQKETKSGY